MSGTDERFAWQVVSGPTEFDAKSINTKVEFTTNQISTNAKQEIGVFIESTHEIGVSIWAFQGRISGLDLTLDHDLLVTGVYNVTNQDGNMSEVDATA